MTFQPKLASSMLALALLATACGGASDSENAATTTSAAATATTPAGAAVVTTTAPATTGAPTTVATTTTVLPTPAEIAAEHMLPMKDGTTVMSAEEMDGRTEFSMMVAAAPPPNYGAP